MRIAAFCCTYYLRGIANLLYSNQVEIIDIIVPMEQHRRVQFLSFVTDYISSVPETDQAIIAAHVECMRSGDFESVHTKQLRGPIRELIVGHHRLTYFEFGANLYFVRGFRKKTAKTPKSEIDYTEKVYKILKGSK